MSSTLRWLRAGYLIGSYVIESLYVPMIINQYWYGNEKPHIKITSLQFITPIMNLNDMYNTCCVYETSILCGWLSPLGWWVDNYEQSFQSVSLYQAVYWLEFTPWFYKRRKSQNLGAVFYQLQTPHPMAANFMTWQTFHGTFFWQKFFKRIRNHCHNGRTRSLGVIEIIFFSFAQ